jgi:hypothetical protein
VPLKGLTENLSSLLLQSIVIPAHHSFSPENGGFNLDSAGYIIKVSESQQNQHHEEMGAMPCRALFNSGDRTNN